MTRRNREVVFLKLYNNDAYREEFMKIVYSLLRSDGTNDRANQIIYAFDSAPAIEAEPVQSIDPLTLEELREMDGEPVWISPAKENGKVPARWMLVSGYKPNKDIYLFEPSCNITQGYDGKSYGKTWLAYRRKPEEGKDNETD